MSQSYPRKTSKKIPKTPSYLTKNRFGVYSFQVRLPVALIKANPTLQPLVRFTLKTCERAVAVRLARRKIIVLDTIKAHFGNDHKAAAEAIKLWKGYEDARLGRMPEGSVIEDDQVVGFTGEDVIAAGHGGYEAVDEFLGGLDNGERHILEIALQLEPLESVKKLEQEKESFDAQLGQNRTEELPNLALSAKPPALVQAEADDDISLLDAYRLFINAKKANDSASASIVAYELAVTTFVDILCALTRNNGLTVSAIQPAHVRKYVELMSVMPMRPKQNGITDKMTVSKIIELVDGKSKVEVEALGLKCLSPKTIGNRFTTVREFLKFVCSQQYPIKPGLGDIVKFTGKAAIKVTGGRRGFNANELKLLFESASFRHCKFGRPCDYWAPLLALFTGARQGELVQLYVEDIYQQDGTWVIDINDKDDKRLKNEGARRVVPLHPQLEKLGFIRYLAKCKAAKEIKLFPDEVRNDRDQFAYSKRFSYYRKKCGVVDAQVDFHSFRHLVAGVLIGEGVVEGIANDIVGHASQYRSETVRTYAADGTFMAVKVEALKNLKYGINFNYVKFWR